MTEYRIINRLQDLIEFSKNWTSKDFAFDTEFTSLPYMQQKIIGMSVYDDKTNIPPTFFQFNFDYDYITKEKNPAGGRKKLTVDRKYYKTDAINFEDAKPYLLEMFEGAKCICANAKTEWKIFNKYGITNWRIGDDVNLMSWMLNVDLPKGLKESAKRVLKINMESYTDMIKQKVSNIDWNLVDWEQYGKYGAEDAWATYLIRDAYLPEMKKWEALYECYREMEIPLTYVVAGMEMSGVQIDLPYLKTLSDTAGKKLVIAEQEIYDSIGVEFNINSPKQLAEILFDRLGLPVIKRSEKTKERSTDEGTLEELSFMGHDIADDILEYRTLKKLKSTYMDKIPKIIDVDGRLRGSFNATGTATARFSSSNPNLQNQPNNKEFPIKRAFVPKPGYKFLVYDWSTIEVRIMAHESQDPKMVEIFMNGRDIHQETTDNVNVMVGLALDRDQGKTINFGVLYLMGADSLAYMLNEQLRKDFKKGLITMAEYKQRFVTVPTAQKIIDGYFDTYVGFAQFVKEETQIVKQSGWSWTLGGHRRPVPDLRLKGRWGFGKRKAVNTPIQGGAGDLMKMAMIKLAKRFYDECLDAKILLSVHDELVVEAKDDHRLEEASRIMKEVMENVFPGCLVPIVAEGGIFEDWAGLKQGGTPKAKAKRRKSGTLERLKWGLHPFNR